MISAVGDAVTAVAFVDLEGVAVAVGSDESAGQHEKGLTMEEAEIFDGWLGNERSIIFIINFSLQNNTYSANIRSVWIMYVCKKF